MTSPTLTPSVPVALAVDAHKGTRGAVLVVAGSHAYPGAAILAALGAGRSGAGFVHLALPDTVVAEVLPAVPFAIVVRGRRGGEWTHTDDRDAILAAAARCGAVVVGPGLGAEPATAALVTQLITDVDVPLVLDADGLNALAQAGLELLDTRRATTVLTPHPGEFARLTGRDATPRDDGGRRRVAEELAQRFEGRVVVVLKGHHTVVTDGQRTYVEQGGNPGMATGGMGDVLAGVCATLLAQDSDDPARTTALAVAAHARAADEAARALGERALLPMDVAEQLGRALETFAHK